MKNGLSVPKIAYNDALMINGEKHIGITINTQKTPFVFSIYYPSGPEIFGHNLGFKSLLGQESITASITLTSNMEMVVKTDIYNIKISLRGPHKDFKPLVSAEISYTEKNEKIFEFTLYNEGKTVKVHLFSSFFFPKYLSVCTEGQACSSQLSGYLNFEIDFATLISNTIVPAHTFSLGITKDFENLIEIQHSMNQFPYTLSVSCPAILAQPVSIRAIQETGNTVVVKVDNYPIQDIKITTIGTVSSFSYAETSLVNLDVDLINKKISFSLSVFVKPVITLTWAVSDSITKNNIIVDIDLPVIGHVMKTNLNYEIKSLYDCTIKAIVTGELPTVGEYVCNNDFTYFIAGKTGKVNYNGSAQFISGLLAVLPPTTSTVTTSYDLETLTIQSAVLASVADKTVGVKVVDNKIIFVY